MTALVFEGPNGRPMVGASNPNAAPPADATVVEMTMADGSVARVTTRAPAVVTKP